VAPPKELFRLTVKHALNALSYREIGLAELDVPVIDFAPDYLADHTYRAVLQVAAEADTLSTIQECSIPRFSSREEFDKSSYIVRPGLSWLFNFHLTKQQIYGEVHEASPTQSSQANLNNLCFADVESLHRVL
jgi:hypothetical protein